MRVLGIDYGLRRIGLAVSDASGTLARPLSTIERPAGGSDADLVDALVALLEGMTREDEPVSALVVGLPRRLDGTPNAQTPVVEAFARRLAARTSLPVALQDERLTSREAESLLAVREKDWRRRKQKLDAASAAIILQDYLDARRPPATAAPNL